MFVGRIESMVQLLTSAQKQVNQRSSKPMTITKCPSHRKSVDSIAGGGIEPFGVTAERKTDKDARYDSRHGVQYHRVTHL